MTTLTTWAIALAVCVLCAWSAADLPTDDQTASLIAADVEQAPIDAAKVARGE